MYTPVLSLNKMTQSTASPSAAAAPIKIDKWNLQEVRVAFDDCVVKFMNEEAGYKEDNLIIHTKLLVYFLLNVVGVVTGLYSYLVKPFERTRLLVAIGSGTYLVFAGIWNLVLQYYITPTTYRGTSPSSSKKVWIRTGMKYPEAVYSLSLLSVKDGSVLGKSIEFGVGKWVDVDGNVLYETISNDLQSQLIPKLKHD